MANLDSIHTWERWAPNIGDNRKRTPPALFLELATGLTAAQLAGVGAKLRELTKLQLAFPDSAELTPEQVEAGRREAVEAFKAAVRGVWVEALGAHVRVEGGPHTVQGQPLATLDDYVKLVQQRADFGFAALQALREALDSFNGFEGPDELFSPRSSGGARSTERQSAAKDEGPKGAR
jgi:hypothetical protein